MVARRDPAQVATSSPRGAGRDIELMTRVASQYYLEGMTQDEAIRAGRGRQSFVVILLRDASSGYSGLIFIDAEAPDLFGQISLDELERSVNQAAAGINGLSNSVARVRSALAQEFRSPTQR